MNKQPVLIQNGEIVTPYSRFKADLLIKDGIIDTIGNITEEDHFEIIDCTDKLILPGIIDCHTHMELPMKDTSSADSFSTGTIAAAYGGITTIIDFAGMAEGKNLVQAFNDRKSLAFGNCATDWSLHSCIKGWTKAAEKAVTTLLKEGVTSFKMFTVYRDRGMMSEDSEIYNAMSYVSKAGGIITAHCESQGLTDAHTEKVLEAGDLSPSALAESRPNHVEAEAVQRLITFAEITGGRLYIVHMSARESLRALVEGRRKGVDVSGETCPQYLLLNRNALEGADGHLYTCVPPLRDPIDNLTLWDGVEDGHISTIATDHCPFNSLQKAEHKDDFTKMPLGLAGVETLLPLIYNFGVKQGRISVSQMVQLLSTNPAMIFGMYPQKGILQPGSDGDVTIFDPRKEMIVTNSMLHSKVDYSPYEGMKIKGWPVRTILRGKTIVKDGKYTGKHSDGKFVIRTPYGA